VNRTSTTRITGAIQSFLSDFTAEKGIFPVEILIRGRAGDMVVEVFIDGDAGVDTAACVEISRALAKSLDEGVLKDENYALTVSSPGLDRPLKFPRQYPKHAGREIALVLRSGGATERFRGRLVDAGESSIRVSADAKQEPREIPFADIVEAKIEPPW
jgi:ribosome maturation factor RimP